jgi:nucleoside-diphosphate-sugar epimerase
MLLRSSFPSPLSKISHKRALLTRLSSQTLLSRLSFTLLLPSTSTSQTFRRSVESLPLYSGLSVVDVQMHATCSATTRVLRCYDLILYNLLTVSQELLDPAVIGTTGILKSIKKNAPSVKRVVITSSFASIEEALESPPAGYRASKTFAEKASWDFVEKEKPNFTISTINPPLVLGPIVHYLNSLESLNTSNQRIRDIYQGKAKDEIPETGTFLWVDVRDLALCHVKAIEVEAAANKRFFVTAGHFSNKEIAQIIKKEYPETKNLPSDSTSGGDYPKDGVYSYDNSRTKEVLGIQFKSLHESIKDTVKSFQSVGA